VRINGIGWSSAGSGRVRTDAELMADVHARNGDALEALFRRYVGLVRRVAVEILRDRAEAEDVTQEVFLEIYRKAHLYDPARGSVRVWLLQYAYHRTLRRKSALRRRAAYGGEPLDDVELLAERGRRTLTREECEWVIRAGLARLPERQRTTLELACFEELTLRDVAARLGVSVGCTRHYYYRGLARLKLWARAVGAPRPPGDVTAPRRRRGRRTASTGDRADGGTTRAPRLHDRAERRAVPKPT
jgi:RNA polymerase sigma-70 factor (ECF subfamily)